MTTLILKGVSRDLTIHANSKKRKELLSNLVEWIEYYHRFTSHEGNSYIFPSDNCIAACTVRAQKMGLIEIKRKNDFIF